MTENTEQLEMPNNSSLTDTSNAVREMLSEGDAISSMRVMCIMCVAVGLIVALVATGLYAYSLIKNDKICEITPLTVLSGALISAGLGAKYFQKGKEA